MSRIVPFARHVVPVDDDSVECPANGADTDQHINVITTGSEGERTGGHYTTSRLLDNGMDAHQCASPFILRSLTGLT